MMIGDRHVAAMRRAPKWPGSNQRRKDTDGDGWEVRRGVEARAKRITAKGALHHRVQVRISSTGDEAAPHPIFKFGLCSLGAERLGVHCGSKLGSCEKRICDGLRHPKLDQPLGGNKFNQVREFIVKVGDSQFCEPIEKALLNAAVIRPGLLGSNGSNVELRNELRSITECLQQAEQRRAGIRDAGLFDARAEISAKLRPAENLRRIGTQQVIGKGCSWSAGHAEHRVFLNAATQSVIKTVGETACQLQSVAGVGTISGRHSEIWLGGPTLGFIAKSKQRCQPRLNLIFGLGIDKITIGAGYELIRIRLNKLENRLAAYRVSVCSAKRDRRANVL